MSDCTEWGCEYPYPEDYKRGSRWQCPACGTAYVRTRRIRERFWRNWSAPNGMWRLPLFSKK